MNVTVLFSSASPATKLSDCVDWLFLSELPLELVSFLLISI